MPLVPLDHDPLESWLAFTLVMVICDCLWLYYALTTGAWVGWAGYGVCLVGCLFGGWRAGRALRSN